MNQALKQLFADMQAAPRGLREYRMDLLLAALIQRIEPCSDDCSAGSDGTEARKSGESTTTTAVDTPSSTAAPTATTATSGGTTDTAADSPPPVPEWCEKGVTTRNNILWFVRGPDPEVGYDLTRYPHAKPIEDRINSGLTALRANRDWWRERAEELKDELAAADNQIDTKVRESEKVWQRIRDLEQQLTAPRTFHRCKGQVRPYPSIVCSASLHHADSDNFDPVAEITRLEQQVARLARIETAVQKWKAGTGLLVDVDRALAEKGGAHAKGIRPDRVLQEPDTTTPPSPVTGANEVVEGVEYKNGCGDRWKIMGSVVWYYSLTGWCRSDQYRDAGKFRRAIARGELVPVKQPDDWRSRCRVVGAGDGSASIECGGFYWSPRSQTWLKSVPSDGDFQTYELARAALAACTVPPPEVKP